MSIKRAVLLAAAILIALSLSACAVTADITSPPPTPMVSPTPTALPSTAPSISHESLPGGYIPNSGSGLYEDEDYIIFKSGNDILVYDKSGRSVQTSLRRCSAFTYSEGVIYYAFYDSQDEQRCIRAYDIKSGNDKIIENVKNFVPSMLASGGRLYYSLRTDPEDELSTELFSMLPEGGDLRSEGISGFIEFCVADGSIYYNGSGICEFSGGTAKKIIDEEADLYKFEVMGGRLFYWDGSGNICAYDIATGKIEQCVHPNGWDADFALLGQNIIYAEPGDFIDETPGKLRVYTSGGVGEDGLQLELNWYEMYTSGTGAYFSPYSYDGTCKLYRIALNEGKPAYEQVFSYTPNKTPSDDTVIFAGAWGSIYGGYSGGEWLSHSEAAAYCKNPVKFYEYNLLGKVRIIQSSGVTSSDVGGGYIGSAVIGMDPQISDENGYFSLNIPERQHKDISYSKDPLCYTYLYSVPPKMLLNIQRVSDTSYINPLIQDILDEKFGKGVAEAAVRIAVNADIDGDSQKETIVNADNCADEFEYSGGDVTEDAMGKPWYCMSFIIDEGEMVMISDFYSVDEEGYWAIAFMYVQNIIDLDGDGKYEIVLDWSAWEMFYTEVYKYDGNTLTQVLYYCTGS